MQTLDLSQILRTEDGVAPDAILVVDADGRIVFFNQRYAEMWGVPEDVLAEESDAAVRDFVQQKLVDPQGFLDRIAELYATPEEEARDELTLVDGRTLERFSGPLRNRDGTLYGRVWFFRDVTDQRAREAALRRQLDQLAAVYAMASAVEEAEDVESMTREAFDTFERLLGADRVALLLTREDGGLRFVAWRGLSADYRGAIEERAQELPHLTPEPVSVPDVEQDPSFRPLREIVAAEGIRALAFIPLSYGGRLIGRLVAYFDQPRQLTDDELQLAQTLARHLSLAVARRQAEDALRVSRDELAAILGGVTDGITVQDPTGRLVYANDAAAQLLRVGSADELVASQPGEIMQRFEVLTEDGRPFPLERYPGRRALAGVDPGEEIVRWRFRDTGEERWSIVNATPVLADDGRVRLAINIFRDITERRRDEQQVAFLAEAGDVLNRSLDYGQTLAEVARLAVPRIADWCVVYTLEEDGTIRRLAVEDHAGRANEVRRVLEQFEIDPTADEGVPAVLRSGRPLLQPEVTSQDITRDVHDADELARATADIGITSAMTVPLSARGRVLGAIAFFATESGRRFGEPDLELAEELARRASTAVDNALLFKEAQESFALLETLLATAPVGLGFWDRELRYVRVNDAMAALNGISPDDHVGRHLREVVPKLADQLEPLYRRVIETGEPYVHLEQTTAELPLEPGSERHWLSSYYPVRTADGDIVGLGAVIVEITERKRAEQERARLLAAEQAARAEAQRALEELKFKTTLLELQSEASPDGLLVVSSTGAIISVNRRFAELWGMPDGVGEGGTDEAALAVAIEQVEDPDAFLARVRDIYADPAPTQDEVRLRDGRVFERHGAPVRGDDGTYYGFLWSFRDITERHRADLRLRLLAQASEILSSQQDPDLQRIAELALHEFADACSVFLPRGKELVRVARAHADPAKLAVLDSLPDRYPIDGSSALAAAFRDNAPQLTARVAAHDRAVEQLGIASNILLPLATHDEPIGMISFSSTRAASYDEADLAFARELARRIAVRLENARLFHEAAERAQASRVLDAVGDGVFLVDAAGVIRLWNPAAEQVTGLRSEDVVGRTAADAIPGWTRTAPLVPVADWPQAAATFAETVPLDVGVRELWLSISGVGFADGTVYAFRDLTEERTVEQLKSDFVSTVSHELRTPLAAIYGAALTLGRYELALEEEQQRRLLDVIAGEADRLARTVNDILWASRLDSGQLHVTIESCDPVELASSVVTAQRMHLPANVKLVFDPPQGLPAIRADADKLRQVLTNLLDNAIKYSPDGGRVDLDIERSQGRIRFVVRDRGLGIPAGEQERIFEKFYRLDPQLTRGVGGTGLGLYICRELVRRMEGRIWLSSLPGDGSTFVVELPAV